METPPNSLENQEEAMEYGKNVVMIINLIRHGEKDKEGNLTERGRQEAGELGEKLRQENPDSAGVKSYTSDFSRTQETGRAIIGEDDRFKQRGRDSLSLRGKLSEEAGKELIGHINKETGDESRAVQLIIDTGSERMDPETISSKEISQGVAKEILELIRLTGRLKENSNVDVVMVSHSGLIENFIVDILKEQREDFVERTGGQLKFLEGIRFGIDRQDKDNVGINVSFRNYNLNITEEDLREIINS